MKVTIIGAGTGGNCITVQGIQAIESANLIIGSPRLLDSLPVKAKKSYACSLPIEMANEIAKHTHLDEIAVVVSGDPGFYSAASQLLARLKGQDVSLIPGISTPQALASSLGRPWQKFHLVSAHGLDCDIVSEAINHRETFFLTGNDITPAVICRRLCDAGLGDAAVFVGEHLGCPQQAITSGTAQELACKSFSTLSAVLVENHKTFRRNIMSPGIPDHEFLRGDVPMTKREIRVQALSLLEIKPDSILWDVGAGTGSVAIEMALLARKGRVHAVEKNTAAACLAASNREHFGTYNLTVHHGEAPGALKSLPPPCAVFVGGSAGNLDAILDTALQQNPSVRVVVSAITLETLAAGTAWMERHGLCRQEIVQVGAARAGLRAGYHMLDAVNPVFLLAGRGAGPWKPSPA